MIIGKKVSTTLFSYFPESKTFSTEESTLRANRAPDVFGRLYDDACDEGFVLVSQRTGKEVAMYLASIDTNKDNEIAGWHFKPVSPRHDFSVFIIND